MKKLLSLISTIGIISTSVTSVVACTKSGVTDSDSKDIKKQVEVAIKNGNLLFTTKQNEKDKEKYFAAIKMQLIKLFDDAKIKYEKSKFKFETEFKEQWFKEAKEQIIESYIEIKDGFNFNQNGKSLKIEKVKIKLIVEKIEKKDLKEVIKVKRLQFDNKNDPVDQKKLQAKIKEQNQDIDIRYINVFLEENNINTHKATVEPTTPNSEEESIYTGEVEVDIVTPLSDDVKETNLGKFTGKEDEPSIEELHTQILDKNSSFGYNQDKVEILDITASSATLKAKTDDFYIGEVKITYEYSKKISLTDIQNVLKDPGLKFDSKKPTEEDIKQQIKKQNQDINIDAVKLENINTNNHTATAVGDGKIYTGAVNLVLKYDIKLDIRNINLQVAGAGEIPEESEVDIIVKKYNSDYVSEQAEFVGSPTKEKAIIKGTDAGFYYNQVEISYKYISYAAALDVVKKAEIKVKLRLRDSWNTFLVKVRDYLAAEIKKEAGIIVPENFGLQTGWSDDWTSEEKHSVGDVFEIRTFIKIMTGFGKALPTIDENEHPPIQITIVA